MKRVLQAISLFCAIGLSAIAAGAAPLDDAVAAYDSGDYRQALARLRPLAEQRNAVAQFYLGIMHANGSGVPRDLAEAQRLYRLAAAQGHAPAQFNLGVMHLNGFGVPKDAAEARKFYQQAAATRGIRPQRPARGSRVTSKPPRRSRPSTRVRAHRRSWPSPRRRRHGRGR